MRPTLTLSAALAACVLGTAAAPAATVRVDLTSQTMHVSSQEGDYVWPISSAREGFSTPRGSYGVQRLETMHYSHKYHNSPMPHSIFFRGGYAIHGTTQIAALGTPASHGCIRLAPENAAVLYEIVRHEGARIAITGTPGAGGPAYAQVETSRPARGEVEATAYGYGDDAGYGAAYPRGDDAYDAQGRPLRRRSAYAARFVAPQPAPPQGLFDWLGAQGDDGDQ